MPVLQRFIGLSIALFLGGIIVSAILRLVQYTLRVAPVRRTKPSGAAPGRARTGAAARPAPTRATQRLMRQQPQRRVRGKPKLQISSAQQPMPAIQGDRVINELYSDSPNRKISKNRIMEAVSKAAIDPDVSTIIDRIPDESYKKQELIDALNTQVRRRRVVTKIGLFGVGPTEEAQPQQQEKVKQA